MNEVQKLQLDILIKLDEVCRNNNIRYYIAYGTCIGAVREKGFIEWDHDIDVLMHIDDATKLENLQNELGENYFLNSINTNPEYKKINMHIIDKKHKYKIFKSGKETEVANIGIDIYPFYYCPTSKIKLLSNIWKSHYLKILVGGAPNNHGFISKYIAKLLLLFSNKTNRKQKIEKLRNDLNYKGQSDEIADYYGLDVKACSVIKYKKEWFAKPSLLEFEGFTFYGPTNPHEYLTTRYGDYMTPLSKEEREEEEQYELLQ